MTLRPIPFPDTSKGIRKPGEDERYEPPFANQAFDSLQQWVNKASSWLTRHPQYNDTAHGETKGWRGPHFTAMCFDSLGRRCRNGGDFQRAHEENAFPVWWIWPDQIVELVQRSKSREQIQLAIDYLLETKQGSPARSAAHNARLVLQDIIKGDA